MSTPSRRWSGARHNDEGRQSTPEPQVVRGDVAAKKLIGEEWSDWKAQQQHAFGNVEEAISKGEEPEVPALEAMKIIVHRLDRTLHEHDQPESVKEIVIPRWAADQIAETWLQILESIKKSELSPQRLAEIFGTTVVGRGNRSITDRMRVKILHREMAFAVKHDKFLNKGFSENRVVSSVAAEYNCDPKVVYQAWKDEQDWVVRIITMSYSRRRERKETARLIEDAVRNSIGKR